MIRNLPNVHIPGRLCRLLLLICEQFIKFNFSLITRILIIIGNLIALSFHTSIQNKQQKHILISIFLDFKKFCESQTREFSRDQLLFQTDYRRSHQGKSFLAFNRI